MMGGCVSTRRNARQKTVCQEVTPGVDLQVNDVETVESAVSRQGSVGLPRPASREQQQTVGAHILHGKIFSITSDNEIVVNCSDGSTPEFLYLGEKEHASNTPSPRDTTPNNLNLSKQSTGGLQVGQAISFIRADGETKMPAQIVNVGDVSVHGDQQVARGSNSDVYECDQSIQSSFEGSFEDMRKNDDLNTPKLKFRPVRGSNTRNTDMSKSLHLRQIDSTEIMCDETLATPILGTGNSEYDNLHFFKKGSLENNCFEEYKDDYLTGEHFDRSYSEGGLDFSKQNTILVGDTTLELGLSDAPSGYSTPKRLSALRLSDFREFTQPTTSRENVTESNSASTLNNIARLRALSRPSVARPVTMHIGGATSSTEYGLVSDFDSRGFGESESVGKPPALSLFSMQKNLRTGEPELVERSKSLQDKIGSLIAGMEIQQKILDDIENDPAMVKALTHTTRAKNLANPTGRSHPTLILSRPAAKPDELSQPESWFYRTPLSTTRDQNPQVHDRIELLRETFENLRRRTEENTAKLQLMLTEHHPARK